jgi:hypothetical protein
LGSGRSFSIGLRKLAYDGGSSAPELSSFGKHESVVGLCGHKLYWFVKNFGRLGNVLPGKPSCSSLVLPHSIPSESSPREWVAPRKIPKTLKNFCAILEH